MRDIPDTAAQDAMTPDEYLAKCLEIIGRNGHMVQYVFDPDGAGTPPFGYTVGLSTHDRDYELVVSGLPYKGAADVLNQAAEALKERGVSPSAGLVLQDALGEVFPFKLREAHAAGPYPMIDQITGSRCTVWQVLWPDPQHRFPDDEGYAYSAQQDFSLPPTPRDDAHMLALALIRALTPGVLNGIDLAQTIAEPEASVAEAMDTLKAWTDNPGPDHPIKVPQLLPIAETLASIGASAIGVTHGRGHEAADRWRAERKTTARGLDPMQAEIRRSTLLLRLTAAARDDVPAAVEALAEALGEATARDDGAFQLLLALAHVTAQALAAAMLDDEAAIFGLLDQSAVGQ